MTFVVKKLRPAEEDALEAAVWYDEREQGLGDDFLDEVDSAVRALSRDALIHRVRNPIADWMWHVLQQCLSDPCYRAATSSNSRFGRRRLIETNLADCRSFPSEVTTTV